MYLNSQLMTCARQNVNKLRLARRARRFLPKMSANKYLKLVKLNTEYAKRMEHLSNRIFGEVTRPTNDPSMKVVKLFMEKPLQKQDYFTKYYPRTPETTAFMLKLREYGLYRDEHQDFKEEVKRLRILRGKIPPKKGEGKRSKK